LEPGVWTKYKIEVEGRKARLYVHGAEQPCLIVNDLKLEPRQGGVALWVWILAPRIARIGMMVNF